MKPIDVYTFAKQFSKNTLRGLIYRYRQKSYYSLNEIPVSVAEDCYIKSLGKEMDDTDICIFCKYRTRQLYFEDIKHKTGGMPDDVLEKTRDDTTVIKTGYYTHVEVLKKRETIKQLTLEGKTNDEIIEITGYPRSTICLHQKLAGVKAKQSRSKYTQEQADFVKSKCESMTQKQIGELMGLTGRQVEKIARNFGIYFPQHGGRRKMKDIISTSEIQQLTFGEK